MFSVGVKAGVPLTDNLISGSDGSNITTSEPQHWLVGPTVELHLPFRLSFEADALYRENAYQIQRAESAPAGSSEWFTGGLVSVIHHYSLNNWQFPFLAKYELRGGTFRPFLDAGVSLRHVSGGEYVEQANAAGVAVGGGVTFKFLFIRVSPEVRYTHWGQNQVDGHYIAMSQNQTDLMVGFTF